MTQAIILAGGLGTRLRSVVSNVPKSMAPINGKPFLEYQMDYWIGQGVSSFIISVGYLKEKIIEHFRNSYKNIPIKYSVEISPLGTGGGLLMAADKINDPFLLLNGDTWFEVNLSKLINFHREKGSECTFSLFKTEDFNRYMAIQINENGKITHLRQKSKQNKFFANGGVYFIDPKILRNIYLNNIEFLSLEEQLFPDLFKKNTKFYGLIFEEKFIDIGIPDDYKKAKDMLV